MENQTVVSSVPVLVVEPSATLRHALQRLFAATRYRPRLTGSYEAGLRELKEPREGTTPAAVLVGFPAHATTPSDELLAALRQPEHAATPVVLFAHAATAETFDWVARRPCTALLLWDDYLESLDMLERLLAPRTTEPVRAVANDVRVLFVDDSRTVRLSFKRLLQRHGYVVEIAANASEAFTLATQQPFDIAIVDYHMPGGNGDALCRQLREDPRTEGITTAIITATYLEQVIRDSLDAGAIECMFKNEADALFLTRLAAMSRAIRAKKSIEAERQRLAGILGSVGDGVYGVNSNGRITFVNPAACRILGFEEPQTLIGRSAHKLFHHAFEDGRPNPPESCPLQQAYAAGDQLKAWETVFWSHSGHAVPVECTVYPLRVEDRLEGSVVAFRDVSERRQLERELLWQANHDVLTKLHNRNHFERVLEAEVARLKRSSECSALLYIDLDRFKYINDTAGHAAGDRLLCEIAGQLKLRLRESDVLARLGGDEFALVVRNVDREQVLVAAEGFREVLEDCTFVFADKNYKVNGSVGVALIDRQTASPGEALSNADIACHIAKTRGRNQTHLYRPESDEKIAMHLELGWSARLQEALKEDSFRLQYQPIVALAGLAVDALPLDTARLLPGAGPSHFEVLLRLADRRAGLVLPNAFLPTAERFGLMPQIDLWVLTHALARLAALRASGLQPTFTINLSGQTLDSDSLVPHLKSLLARHSIDTRSLIFEITETSAIANIEGAKRLINEIRDLGCRFALDDFGTGFSSFYHLKHLPVDFVKIDGQFVRGMPIDPIDRAIVGSINDIAHSFGKLTVAEFVESRETLGLITACGVDFAQGHYIASPHDLALETQGVTAKQLRSSAKNTGPS